MKYITISFFLFLNIQLFSQEPDVKYVITAEARALMCPFLSPKLIESLEKKGAKDVYKDEELKLHFTTKKGDELSDDIIFSLINRVGYEAKNFKIERSELKN